MIRFILIPLAIMLSCGSTKTNQSAKTDSTIAAQTEDLNQRDSVIDINDVNALLPTCIKNKIDSFKLKEPHERPQRVLEYIYKTKKVYLVVLPCCDFFNEVYDDKCNYLGAPDGGFTGKGDGKIPDFFEEAKNEKLVWGTPK
ncbi:MAG: hypothetical protein IPL54_00930 [Chitinophagaceae bacterium]|nr:hypothetical protein [Chitinophagaceae bacterium]